MTAYVTLFLSVLLVMASLLVHEMGHWIVLARHNVKIIESGLGFGPELLRIGRFRLRLLPLGAYIVPENFNALPPNLRFLSALAGPGASALYAAVLGLGAALLPTDTGVPLELLAQLNLLLAAINLLPFPPLDGWRMLEAGMAISGRTLRVRTKQVAERVGSGMVWGVGFLLLGKVFLGS